MGCAALDEAEALRDGVLNAALDAVITARPGLPRHRLERGRRAHLRLARRGDRWAARSATPSSQGHHRAAHEAGLRATTPPACPHVLGQRLELEAMRADGSIFPCELSIHEVKAAGRSFFTAWLRDLTPLREAQAELARQRERLHQSEKMSALGSLLAASRMS
jgi:hypothetical protein